MPKKLIVILVLLSTCIARSQSVYDTLSVNEKLEGLSKFWREATYNFVFFDHANINWDSAYLAYIPKILATKNVFEYLDMLNRFAHLLKDGHTDVFIDDYYFKDVGQPRIAWVKFGDKRFVNGIDSQLVNDIPIGTELVAINHFPMDTFNLKGMSIRSTLKGTPFIFTFRNKEGKLFDKTIYSKAGKDQVTWVPAPKPTTPFEAKIIDDNICYVRINTFADKDIPQKFEDILPMIRKAKALIIDIRRNGGGNDAYAKPIAKHLVDRKFIVETAWKQRVHKSANKALGSTVALGMHDDFTIQNKDYYDNNVWEVHGGDTTIIADSIEKIKIPIAILIGPGTISAAEDFLIMLDGSKNIKLYGQNTAGSSGQPEWIKITHGISMRICAKRDTYPDGRDFINVGINPDVLVARTLDDYVKNRDAELEAALTYFKKGP